MNQQETTSEWLARKKAALGRLQGSYRVPGTSLDKVAINRPAEDQVTNEIIFMPIGVVIKALFSEIVDFTNIFCLISNFFRREYLCQGVRREWK